MSELAGVLWLFALSVAIWLCIGLAIKAALP